MLQQQQQQQQQQPQTGQPQQQQQQQQQQRTFVIPTQQPHASTSSSLPPPPMMIRDEHMQEVSSRLPLPYIKEEAETKEESAPLVSAAAGDSSAQSHDDDNQQQQAEQQEQQQQLVAAAASGAGGGSAADPINDTTAAGSADNSFSLSDAMPAIIVQQMTPVTSRTAVARLTYQNDVLFLLEAGHVVIGRNSSTSIVHFHVGRSSFISRKHFQVVHDPMNQEFFVLIVSKNGIFVDDTFQRRNTVPERLPPVCQFRFPSTDIRIVFESFLTQPHLQFVVPPPVENGPPTLRSAENPFLLEAPSSAASSAAVAASPTVATIAGGTSSNNGEGGGAAAQMPMPPMIAPPPVVPIAGSSGGAQPTNTTTGAGSKMKLTKVDKRSPPLSPTGTLSAANSCPTSPRQSFREYHAYGHQPHLGGGPSTSAAAVQQQQQFINNGYAPVGQPQLQQQQQQPIHDALLPPPPPASAAASGVLAPPPPPAGHPNEFDKPLFSYAQLIVQSISASPEKQLTLSGIYSFITKHYPYYRREANKGWQNSIRHNLSLNRYFLKVERSQDEPGKGSFWRIDPNSEAKLIDQSYRKRRQRGNQNFRAPYGLPRSAPASPNHMDTSREASPLHDIVLQSAPGSPDRFQQQQQQQQHAQQQQQQHHHQQPQQQQQQLQQNIQHQQLQLQQQQQNGSSGGGGGGSGGGNHMQIWTE